jgi:hypothetical protein
MKGRPRRRPFPFQGHLGLYAGMRPHARVEVLLALLGGQQRVTLPRGSIELAPDPAGGDSRASRDCHPLSRCWR